MKAIFYHAGCSVCITAEKVFVELANAEDVNFTENPDRIAEAEAYGVKSVPALVIDGTVFHINHGATMEQVKGS